MQHARHVAATSSKTGCFLYFLRSRKCKQIPPSSQTLTLIHWDELLFYLKRDLNHPSASSSNTGCFLFFLLSKSAGSTKWYCLRRNSVCFGNRHHIISPGRWVTWIEHIGRSTVISFPVIVPHGCDFIYEVIIF